MPHISPEVFNQLGKHLRCRRAGFPVNFNEKKKQLIDWAFTNMQPPPRSFVDLGGVWGVDGWYTFYTLDTYPVDRAYVVDIEMNHDVQIKSQQYDNLNVVQGHFGCPNIAGQIPPVDMFILFDVLLHQVRPDWDAIQIPS